MDRKELLDRERTYLYEVGRGAYQSKEQEKKHFKELYSRPSKCPKPYTNKILGKQIYAKKCVNFVKIQIATN